MVLDNRFCRSTIELSPPTRFRVEWADSQGNVTASWLAAHFTFGPASPRNCGVYYEMMKRIRYAAWLPLVHLAMMAPLIALEEARGWNYLYIEVLAGTTMLARFVST
jgi:hypothetical protein